MIVLEGPEGQSERLVDRQCARIIGALLVGLRAVAPMAAIKRAVLWWGEHLHLLDDAGRWPSDLRE